MGMMESAFLINKFQFYKTENGEFFQLRLFKKNMSLNLLEEDSE